MGNMNVENGVVMKGKAWKYKKNGWEEKVKGGQVGTKEKSAIVTPCGQVWVLTCSACQAGWKGMVVKENCCFISTAFSIPLSSWFISHSCTDDNSRKLEMIAFFVNIF